MRWLQSWEETLRPSAAVRLLLTWIFDLNIYDNSVIYCDAFIYAGANVMKAPRTSTPNG